MPILKTGTFTAKDGKQVTFTEADLDKIVTNTDLSKHEPQFVIEHPTFDKLGFGTIEKLKRVGSHLLALPKTVDEKFKKFVNSGELPGRSASLLKDTLALNHIGFLPPQVEPAVDGLGEYLFSQENDATNLSLTLPGIESHFAEIDEADNNKIEFAKYEVSSYPFRTMKDIFSSIREFIIDKYDMITADKIIPKYSIEAFNNPPRVYEVPEPVKTENAINSFSQNINGVATMDIKNIDLSKLPADQRAAIENQIADLNKQLNDTKVELQTATTKLSASEKATLRTEVLQFMASDDVKLKIKPAIKEDVVNFMMAQKEKGVIEFSAGDNTTKKLDLFEFSKQLIKDMPDVIELSEVATNGTANTQQVSDAVKLGKEIAAYAK